LQKPDFIISLGEDLGGCAFFVKTPIYVPGRPVIVRREADETRRV
jgi:hypothetical protein